jgi:hypothetical protein
LSRTLTFLAMALAACASTTTLTSVQETPEGARAKLRNVLVVGMVKDPAARQSYEMEMVKALQADGVRAEDSRALLPIGAAPTREVLQRLVAEKGFDGALVGMYVDSRTEVRAVPPANVGFYDYAAWAGPVVYAPGYLETTQQVVVETRLFETSKGNEPVFSATSESIDPDSVKDVTEPLAKLVVERLR